MRKGEVGQGGKGVTTLGIGELRRGSGGLQRG